MKTINLILSSLTVGLVLLGCTRQAEKPAAVTVQFPGEFSSANQTAPLSSKVESLNNGSNWNAVVPTSLNEIDCYGIFVGGAEPDMSKSSCTSADLSKSWKFGVNRGFFQKGSSITLEMTPGIRTFYIFGSKSVGGSCGDIFNASSPNMANYSNPFILGQGTAELKSGNNTVSISLSANFTNSAKIGDCQFAGQTGGGGSNSNNHGYGNGLDGNVAIDGTFNTSSGSYVDGSGKTRVFNASRRLKNISNSDPTLIELHNSYNSTGVVDFQVGDEVMWWVVAARQSSTPDSACKTGGESNVSRGTYGFARVTATPSNLHLRLDRVLFSSPHNSNLAAATNSGEFCAIQVVRIPNFAELKISDLTGTNLEAGSFNFTTVEGGLMAFRAQNRILLANNLSTVINAKGKGFAGGLAYSTGSSSEGQAFGSSAGQGNANIGGGGGANAGVGGVGASGSPTNSYPTSAGGLANSFCMSGAICSPKEKIFMGAGGGGGNENQTATTGAGGGVIMIWAKEVVPAGTAPWPYVWANGFDGQNGTGHGGGGGAGGTILIKSEKLQFSFAALQVSGGNGGAVGWLGGAGGGGRILVEHCTTSGTIVPSAAAGLTGGAGTAGLAEVSPGVCSQ